MAAKFNVGDDVYIIESNRYIRRAVILKIGGGFYTIRFLDSGGGIRVRVDRLYASEAEAEAALPKLETAKYKTPYDYM